MQGRRARRTSRDSRLGVRGPWRGAPLGGGVLASLTANSHSEYGRRPPEVTAVPVAGRPAIAFAVAFALLLQQRRADLAATCGAVPVPPGEPRSIRSATPTPATSSSPPQLQPLPVVASALSPEPVPTTRRHPCRNHQCRPPVPALVGKLPVARTDDEDVLVARVWALLASPEGQSLGRCAMTRELDVTEHQARIAMELVTAATGPVLNGTGRRAKLRAAGRGAR